MFHDIRCPSCGYRIEDYQLGINEYLDKKCPKCREVMIKEFPIKNTLYNKKGKLDK